MEVRGEVRRLADAFAEGEVEKASQRLQSAADTHRRILHTLETFLHDNQQLSKLVQELPTKVSHPVMVPFGKAAFFPGKLIHTNEFLVLLGEGYYAECSADKTSEILERRSKLLGSQIAGVKLQLTDLDVESRFFSDTLAEAAGGCVEIREEFLEPVPSGSAPSFETCNLEPSDLKEASLSSTIKEKLAKGKEVVLTNEDKEHERLMARLDELEAAEAAVEMNSSLEKDHPSFSGATVESHLSDEENGLSLTDVGSRTLNKEVRSDLFTVDEHAEGVANTDNKVAEGPADFCRDEGRPSLKSPGDLLKFEEWRRCKSRKGDSNERPEVKLESPMLSPTEQEFQELVVNAGTANQVASMLQTRQQRSSDTSMNKVFTGSVVERSGPTPPTQLTETRRQVQRRPASKFKMRQADK